MADLRLARPWAKVRPQIEADGRFYELLETHSPRDFFAVDPASPYVIRVRERKGVPVLTLTAAPARSASVAAWEDAFAE